MRGRNLKLVREQRGLTQLEAAARLGVSQAYLSLLEGGKRRLNARLARRMMRAYGMPPSVLPPSAKLRPIGPQELAEELAAVGYPGFAYLRSRRRKRNPGELLLVALAQQNLEARVLEALPWLLLRYWDVDTNWLVEQARSRNLQNRMGYLVNLARRVAQQTDPHNQQRNRVLAQLEEAFEQSKLAREDTLCRVLNGPEQRWLQENRPEEARYWNVLTDLRPEDLQYAQ